MKTSRIFVLAALSLLAAACSKEQQTPEVNSDKITLDLFLENGTKTSVDGETGKVSWNDGDLVSIKETGVEAENIDASKISIDEDGVLHVTVADFQSEDNYVTGFYPCTADNKVSDGSVAAVLPAGQDAKAGTFADFVSPTIGYGKISSVKENGLVMKNIGGLIRFKVASAAVSSVKIASNNSEDILAGNYTVTYTGSGDPTIEKTSGSSYITLSGTFDTESSYYIVALPGTLESGITVTVSYSDGTADFVKTGSSALEIKRNGVVSLGTLGGSSSEDAPKFEFRSDSNADQTITASTIDAMHWYLVYDSGVEWTATVSLNGEDVSSLGHCDPYATGTEGHFYFADYGQNTGTTDKVYTITFTTTTEPIQTLTATLTQSAPATTSAISVDETSKSVAATVTSATFNVTASNMTWTATASEGATVTPSTATVTDETVTAVTVSFDANTSTSETKAHTVTITNDQTSDKIVVTITQEAASDASWLDSYVFKVGGTTTGDGITWTEGTDAGTIVLPASGQYPFYLYWSLTDVTITSATLPTGVTTDATVTNGTGWNSAAGMPIWCPENSTYEDVTYTVVFVGTGANGATKEYTLTIVRSAKEGNYKFQFVSGEETQTCDASFADWKYFNIETESGCEWTSGVVVTLTENGETTTLTSGYNVVEHATKQGGYVGIQVSANTSTSERVWKISVTAETTHVATNPITATLTQAGATE